MNIFKSLTKNEMLELFDLWKLNNPNNIPLPNLLNDVYDQNNGQVLLTDALQDLLIANSTNTNIQRYHINPIITDGDYIYMHRYSDTNEIVNEIQFDAAISSGSIRENFYEKTPLEIDPSLIPYYCKIFNLNELEYNVGFRIFRILILMKKINLKYIRGLILSNKDWGNIHVFKFKKASYFTISDLIFEAKYRNIDTDQSLLGIRQELNKQMPPIEWYNDQLNFAISLNEKDKDIVNTYFGNPKHVQLNSDLRNYPYMDAPINRIIEKVPPLPNEIVVFRRISDFSLNVGVFKSLGYLSTSASISCLKNGGVNPCADESIIMKITIAAGSKCLYGSHLCEMLFPHNINILINSLQDVDLPCYDYDNNEYITKVNLINCSIGL